MNTFKTGLLLAALTALFGGVGYLIGGVEGMALALVFAAGTNVFAWWNSDKAVLRMHGAREVDDASAPELVSMVRDLANNAGLPMPRVFVLETEQPNAFATGRNPQNAAVAASRGLLEQCTREEVAAVMAHELAHIEHRDTLTMTVTATLAGAISTLGTFALFFRGNNTNPFGALGYLVALVVAPVAAMLVQMAISRAREYEADRRGAEICGHPEWLAAALERIAMAAGRIPNEDAERAPATAHMFIINPLMMGGMDNLFSTHPNTENRIAALMEMRGTVAAPASRPSIADETARSPMASDVQGPWTGGGRRRGTGGPDAATRTSGVPRTSRTRSFGPWSRGRR